MKLAITHEWLVHPGGSEKVVEAFHEIFPDAPIYTLVYNEKSMPPQFKQMDIRTTFLQKFEAARKNYQPFLPFMPLAFKQLDLSGYDVVLSSSHACAKNLTLPPRTLHICYCYTPMRYIWDFYDIYRNRLKMPQKFLFTLAARYLRAEDIKSSKRVHHFIAISHYIAKRIKRTYNRESDVIYPPVNTEFYVPSKNAANMRGEYYLIVSRLVPYKKMHLAVEAFNELGMPLRVIGDGQDLDCLKSIAKTNIIFSGRVSDEEVRKAYQECAALIFPQEEDFGITAVEVQACGKPVIAYAAGGAVETIGDGKTGAFFTPQTKEALIQAVKSFENAHFSADAIRQNSESFSKERFKREIQEYISLKYTEFKKAL